MSSESAGGVHGSIDEAEFELDVVDDQLEDTYSGEASEALDSPIAHICVSRRGHHDAMENGSHL